MPKSSYDGRYGWLNMNLCRFDGPMWFPSSRIGNQPRDREINDVGAVEPSSSALVKANLRFKGQGELMGAV